MVWVRLQPVGVEGERGTVIGLLERRRACQGSVVVVWVGG